jgi:uncharacterized membrane protein
MNISYRPNLGLFRRRPVEPDRPKIKPEWSPVDWLLEAVALFALFFVIGYVIYIYRILPETIATHFGASGKADGFGNKSAIFFMPGMSLFVYLLLTIINNVPHTFNFPVKITPQNAMRQYVLATRIIRIMKLTIVLLFGFISRGIVASANGSEGLGLWFMPVFLSLIFIPFIIYLVMASRKR